MTYPYLPLATIRRYVPEMARRGVSEVCRGPDGFLAAFIARMRAQMVKRNEPPRDNRGRLTRRHLALIAWAWSPEMDA